jgi:hypothetical protein
MRGADGCLRVVTYALNDRGRRWITKRNLAAALPGRSADMKRLRFSSHPMQAVLAGRGERRLRLLSTPLCRLLRR